jgi:glycosyltransferase involved in cell wall biosynthesis
MSPIKASIVVPAYNAGQTVRALLEALRWQDCGQPFEVIIVDDGSTDDTAAIVAGYPHVRYFRQTNAGPASARNCGARHALGDILLFTDSDCCPRPDWIRRMLSGFSDDSITAVTGSYGIANPRNMLANVIHTEIVLRHRFLMPEFPKVLGSYNFAVRKDFFHALGGFNQDYRRASGEDNDLGYRILAARGRIHFLRDALVDHYHQTSLGKYLQEQFRHGVWRAKMYFDHPRMATGDNYTFWKDMFEVPATWTVGVAIIWPGLFWGLGLALFLFLFEAAFGVWGMRSLGGGGFAGSVMFARAFARSSGFVAGGIKLALACGKR